MARASFYRRQASGEASQQELLPCRLIDKEDTRQPFYGSRPMLVYRVRQGHTVNLKGYGTIAGLTIGLTQYFAFYHAECPHPSLGNRTPNAVYADATGGGASIPDRFGATTGQRCSAAIEARDAT